MTTMRTRTVGGAAVGRAIVACALLLAAGGAPAAAAGAGLARGERVAWTHAGKGPHVPVSDPAVAVRSDGVPLVGWIAAEGDVNHLYVVAPGAADARPVRVDPDGLPVDALHQAPALATGSGGEVFVAWSSAKKKPAGVLFASDLQLSRSLDGGRTFDPPLRINEDRPISHSFEGLARARGGDLLLAWIDSRAGWEKAGTYVARVTERGGKVASTEQLGAETCVCCRVALGAGGDAADGGQGRAAVLWRKDFPGKIRDMVLAVSDDGGARFDAAVRVADDRWEMPACPHRGGGVGVDASGRVHAAWYTEGTSGRPGLFYASSADGKRFAAPQRIDRSDGSIPDHVALGVATDGALLVVWEDATAVRRRVLARVSVDGGETFGPIEQLSAAMKASSPAVAPAPGGGFVVAWNEEEFPHTRTVVLPVKPR